MVKTVESRARSAGFAASCTAAVAGAALLAGCTAAGGTGPDATTPQGVGIIGDQQSAGDPVSGGTLTYAGYSFPSNLDPAGPGTFVSGSTGGTEMASIYDTLMRYDSGDDRYVPQLAQSLEHSDDYLTWTLRLRDGETFSDGSPVDADAVVASIDRYNARNGAHSEQFESIVESVTATAPDTVTFALNRRWNELPSVLAFGHGMIVAPAAYANPDDFTPIGAGPFTVSDYIPGTKIVLEARPDYWGGPPNLDSVVFTAVSGGQGRIESLKSGDVDMAFLREPEYVADAKNRFPGFYQPLSLGSVVEINNRDGSPGSRPKVRKAIAHAINPQVVNDRAFGGADVATAEVFPEWSKWHNDVPALDFDPDKARDLLEQAEADGYDGEISFLSVNDPMWRDIAISVEAMLDDVGFDASVDYVPTITDKTERVYVDNDFDMTYSSYSVSDAAPLLRIDAALNSGSAKNAAGYDSAEMDTLLTEAAGATDDEELQAGLKAVEQEIHDDVPFFSWASGANLVAWNDDVHGAVPSDDGIMLLGNAWVE